MLPLKMTSSLWQSSFYLCLDVYILLVGAKISEQNTLFTLFQFFPVQKFDLTLGIPKLKFLCSISHSCVRLFIESSLLSKGMRLTAHTTFALPTFKLYYRNKYSRQWLPNLLWAWKNGRASDQSWASDTPNKDLHYDARFSMTRLVTIPLCTYVQNWELSTTAWCGQ